MFANALIDEIPILGWLSEQLFQFRNQWREIILDGIPHQFFVNLKTCKALDFGNRVQNISNPILPTSR